MFAPATNHIVNAVSVMTMVVPRSGSLKTSAMIGAAMMQERDRARPEAADLRPALGEPVGEVDDQRQLRELGRVDRRQRPELQPARRAADDDVEARRRTRGRAARARRCTRAPRPAAGSDSRRASSRPSRRGRGAAHWICGPTVANVSPRPTGSPSSPTTSRPSGCRSRRGRRPRRGSCSPAAWRSRWSACVRSLVGVRLAVRRVSVGTFALAGLRVGGRSAEARDRRGEVHRSLPGLDARGRRPRP